MKGTQKRFTCKNIHKFFTLLLLGTAVAMNTFAQNNPTTPVLKDNRADILAQSKSTFDFKTPNNIKDSVVYDAKTRRYIVFQKIGNKYYRTPTSYSFNEYWALKNKQAEKDYFKNKSNTLNLLNRRPLAEPKLKFKESLLNRLFPGEIKIEPQGNLDIVVGYQGQDTKNPTFTERAQKNGNFLFEPNAQVNVNANIGDKMKFPINFNTLSNFDFDNQIKLDYSGKSDEIVKRFQAGTLSFPSRSTLMPGVQSLFGVGLATQFGRLNMNMVLAQQNSQRQTSNAQGANSLTPFEVKADEYEENKHFLLGGYFEKNYNKVMSNLPAITSAVQILRTEVWVTNRFGNTTDNRDVIGFADLGEAAPFRTNLIANPNGLPSNDINNLYTNLLANPDNRNPSLVVNNMTNLPGINLLPVQDFEKTFARKLDSSQYYIQRQAGYISLLQPLQPDEVLAVAYQYSYNGRIFTVGEFSNDLPPDSTSANQRTLFLKLLKATSQRTNLPIWRWMMKNVYSIGFGQLDPKDFDLNVLYQEPNGGAKVIVPFGNKNQGTQIISLLGVERLNNRNDPQPDGKFDFVENFTVFSSSSRIVFPKLEPFGRDLAKEIYVTVPNTAKDTLFYALYDTIKAVAALFPNVNRFVLKGRSRSSINEEIYIGFNVPRGSVTVTAGGRQLQENIDYEINYDLGTLRVTNPSIKNSGVPIQINNETNNNFGIQKKGFMGLRLDYLAKDKPKERLSFGATYMQLSERPIFTKVNLNEDPIRNRMYGFDMNYSKELPKLTRFLDKLPFYQTKAPSKLNFYGEVAYLDPGYARQIGRGDKNTIYLEDFEGSRSQIDIRFPAVSWVMSSAPAYAGGLSQDKFPEARLSNNINYGKNRAQIAWYQIEQTLQTFGAQNNPIASRDLLSDPRVRQIFQKEIFPQRSTDFASAQLTTFDISYYPTERGPYNYDVANVNSNGKFTNPEKRWGGLMRSLDQTDFETANIEFIEFWLQDPFVGKLSHLGGKFNINLGNISEDVLKDGRRFYENGLPTPTSNQLIENSNWGRVPKNPIQVNNAFSNLPEDRKFQDIGFDGITDTAEQRIFSPFINSLNSIITNTTELNKIKNDPSSDNNAHFRSIDIANAGTNTGILERYKYINGQQGNSPISTPGATFSAASTLYPDVEDLNRDNTLNENEEYFQYTLDMKPNMQIGDNFIVDKKNVIVTLPNGTTRAEDWYLFRVPLNQYNKKIGNIPDFKSIRFVRLYLSDFREEVTMRFGTFQFIRNQWRKFQYEIDSTGIYTTAPIQTDNFNVGAVNIEENDNRAPLPYRTPTEIQRLQTVGNNGVNLLLNEQALSLRFCGLPYEGARGVFQTYSNRDLTQFKRMKMQIHAEKFSSSSVEQDKDIAAVIRFGNDFVSNYYEVKIPLKFTDYNLRTLALSNKQVDIDKYDTFLWKLNELDLDLQKVVQIKLERDRSGNPLNKVYRSIQTNGSIISVMGSPNLAEVKGFLLSVSNDKLVEGACGEVWFNELRLTSASQQGGIAAVSRLDLQMADLGTITVAANYHSTGYGNIEQRVNERTRENLLEIDASANIDAGKLLPKKLGLNIPIYAQINQKVSTPNYDPTDKDVKLSTKLKNAPNAAAKQVIKDNAIDFSRTTIFNITNFKFKQAKKPKIYSPSNFDVSYSYIKTEASNPFIINNDMTRRRGQIGYAFSPRAKNIYPLKWLFKKSKSKWFDILKDFNFNPIPTRIAVRAELLRQFGALKPRILGLSKFTTPETYDKYFTFDRNYIVVWPITKSINLDFSATNNARIDEPNGLINTPAKKQIIWDNLLKGGRNTTYTQSVKATYKLPINKIPLFNWINSDIRYQADYNWVGASRLAISLGNIIENNRQQGADINFDFASLYSKSKFFKALESPKGQRPKKEYKEVKDSTFKTVEINGKKVKQFAGFKTRNVRIKNPNLYVGSIPRFFGNLLTMIKSANASIVEENRTTLPGYMDSTKYIGQNFNSMSPGFDFILGYQPNKAWLNKAAQKGLISPDPLFNNVLRQNFNQTFTAQAQVVPFKDFNITLNISKSFSKEFSETFKDTGLTNNFLHLTPYSSGSFDISFISFKTMFAKKQVGQATPIYTKFLENRKILSQRLGKLNPYLTGQTTHANGYYKGYNKYAVDVLIPSFVAAYSGKDANEVGLLNQTNNDIKSNPFKALKALPNWKIDYNGLSRVKGFDRIFSSFNLSHSYSSKLSMNGFNSALLYQDIFSLSYPSFFDTLSQNFVPYFLVPNISIQEQFEPLIGLDMQFTNQLQTKFEYAKSRQVSLSLIDYQISETQTTAWKIGAGYRKKGLKLPFKIKWPKFMSPNDANGSKLDNEMNFKLDLTFRDNYTFNTRLDQNVEYPTGGTKELIISPSIDYFLNSKVKVKLFFDQRKITPYLSTTPPTTTTRAGLQLNISLAQ